MNERNLNVAFLLIGGNVGDRHKNLQKAIDLIAKTCGEIVEMSSVYETAAWGKKDQKNFFNQAISINTLFSSEELLTNILKIEKQLGRERKEKYDPRTIDIDIIFYNDAVIKKDNLVIPHPQMHLRRFVLEPLNQIASQKKHPLLKKTVSELLFNCSDDLDVNKLND